VRCPSCGNDNPEGARFCNACGSRLDASPQPEPAIDPFLPKELLTKLEAARAGRAMEGERRIVTMLFSDVKGSTAMAEDLDPEDWAEIMNGAFERLIAPVYRYEGTLARLMGDAIFAFFGAPIAHEDDPHRAVEAGLDIAAGIAVYRDQLKAERGLDLDVRVGINTGPVMVGHVGSDLRLEYTAMGDAVNVAARMEQTAEPGTVQITEETSRLVDGAFDLESRGGIDVKGKAEPVTAFRVLGRKAGSRGTRGLRGTPLVGRDREIARLVAAIDAVQAGEGRAVSLIGEAGLGKSRLIEETRAEWARRRPEVAGRSGNAIHTLWESWQCVSYDTTRPYAQYRRVLARLAGIEDTDPPEEVRRKLAATIEPGAEEWLEPHMRVWKPLFGVMEPGEDPLEGQAFRDAIVDLVTSSTRAFGDDEPRLLVFEDLHWCDEASMELLIETTKLVDDLACLFLFAYRPDRGAPSWRLKEWLEAEQADRSTEIALAPLSDEDCGRLIESLLPGEDPSIRTRIRERTDGNPLFAQEFAAAVLERDDVEIPTSLQALFVARLDDLDEDSRHTLQLASVIGRTFSESVLRTIKGEGDVSASLRTLERHDLIGQVAAVPEREYEFHHSLTQDATYGTILLRRRRDLHRQVGEVLEWRYASRIEEFAPILAWHFREAGDDEKTLTYATVAGDVAARLYANADAAAHYRDAIDAAGRLDRRDEAVDHLFPDRGRVLELSGRFHEAVDNYEEMEAAARGVSDERGVLAATMALTTLYATPTPVFDATRGRELAERTLALAGRLADRPAEAKALWNLMILTIYGGGDAREAVDAGERSLAIARELDDRRQLAFTLTDLWRPYAAVGDMRSALACLEESRPIWRELDNLPMLCENLSSTAQIAGAIGRNDEALALCDEAYATAEEIGNPWGQSYSLLNAYPVDVTLGNYGRAIARMHECMELGERSGFLIPLALTRADLGVLHGILGRFEEGRELIDEAFDAANEINPVTLPWVLVSKAALSLAAGELDEAEDALARCDVDKYPGALVAAALVEQVRGEVALARKDAALAIEIADASLAWLYELDLARFLPAALLLKGRALDAFGRAEKAEAALREARAEAERLGARPILWQADAALASIASDRGDPAEATQLLAESRATIDAIAATIDDEDLRASFLGSPDVRAVLADA
jgi:class 3 adenylate cyclase/tetratricopeptide (TPR) repeat protein